MFSFEHTGFLIGLFIIVPLILLFVSVLLWKKKVKKVLGDDKLISQLTKNYSEKRYKLKFILISACIILLIVAAANLRKPVTGEKERKAGIDVMIALDVSKSMWAEDTKPSRLDAAKQFISSLLDKLGDNRVGLVLFAGRAFLQMPLTSDFTVAKLYVANASPEAVPMQGTVVGDALQLCENSLNTKEKKYKAVILISDGEDHDPHSTEILQQLADNGVVVNTVGVGSVAGSPITEPGANTYKVDVHGQTVISKLNETELMQIAQQTGGIYEHLGNAEISATKIASVLNSMEKKVIENSGDTKQYASFYIFFVLMALLILIAEIFIPETKKKNRLKYFITILFFLFTAVVNAQPANNYIQKGNDAYRKNDFNAAIESYKNALRKEPENNAARFNLANALQRQNETKEARKNYDEVIAKSDANALKSGSNYNKGMASLKEKDLLQAVTSFKESLKQDPADNNARENLQKALNELKKQQQQNQPQNQKQQQQQQKLQKSQPLNKDMMQQKFNELRNQEKQLQQKLQNKTNSTDPEKDW